MASSEKFDSVEELYKRILPALKTKVNELKRINIKISSIDIWNYCVENKWKNNSDLRIYKLVDDILNIDELKLQMYIKNKNI